MSDEIRRSPVEPATKRPRLMGATLFAHWVKCYPADKRSRVCLLCGLDVSRVGLHDLAYTFEVDGDFLREQAWHKGCLRKHLMLLESAPSPVEGGQ
jgi:hypothetical protein